MSFSIKFSEVLNNKYHSITQEDTQMAVVKINKDNFAQEVLQSDKPVLVDFWASWCGPCKMLSPVVDQISEEHDEIKVCSIDVDAEGDLAAQFGVQAIPTLVVFKNGEAVNRNTGFIPKDQVLALMQ